MERTKEVIRSMG